MSKNTQRLNQYRAMWLFVLFDLPTDSKAEVKEATLFRKTLLEDGFDMMQYSIYRRFCPSSENADVHQKRIKNSLPPYGKISMFRITDRQFGMIETYFCRKPEKTKNPKVTQLTLF